MKDKLRMLLTIQFGQQTGAHINVGMHCLEEKMILIRARPAADVRHQIPRGIEVLDASRPIDDYKARCSDVSDEG